MNTLHRIIGFMFKYGIFAFIAVMSITSHIREPNEHMFTRGVISLCTFVILVRLEEGRESN
jgi:hypothetical protein